MKELQQRFSLMADSDQTEILEDYVYFGRIEKMEFEPVDPMDVYSMYLISKQKADVDSV